MSMLMGGFLVAQASPPPVSGNRGAMIAPIAASDMEDGGPYHIEDIVAIDSNPDIPVSRKVRLFDRATGRLVRETWSDPTTGRYRFDRIRLGPWTIVAYDHTDFYNAVIADNIKGNL